MTTTTRRTGSTLLALIAVGCGATGLYIFGSYAIPSFMDFVAAHQKLDRKDIVHQQIEMDRVAHTLCEKEWATGGTPHHEGCAQYEGIFPGSPGFNEAAWTQYRGEAFQWVCAKRQESAAAWCADYAALIPEWQTFDKEARAAWETANWRYACAPLAQLRVMDHNPFDRDFRQRVAHLRWCDRFTADLDGFAELDIRRTDFVYTRLANIDKNEASWF